MYSLLGARQFSDNFVFLRTKLGRLTQYLRKVMYRLLNILYFESIR